MANVIRDQVFISYGRADQSPIDWLSKLQLHLGLFKRQGVVDVWDDKRIETGSQWQEQIKQAIERAKVAVLLVGPGLLGSKFISEHELPPLLQAAETEGVKIFPLIVGYCGYKKSELEPFQAFNDPDHPLEALLPAEQNKILRDLAAAIEEAFNRP
jgi:TIR domain